MADLADRVPAEIRARLGALATQIARREGAVATGFFSTRDATGAAALLAVAVGAHEAGYADLLVFLLADETDRLFAAAVASRADAPSDVGILLALAGEGNPNVRAQAAAGLARRVANDQGGVLAVQALQGCLDDPGTRVPHAIATTLSGATTAAAESIRERLCDHRSARVRLACRRSSGHKTR